MIGENLRVQRISESKNIQSLEYIKKTKQSSYIVRH